MQVLLMRLLAALCALHGLSFTPTCLADENHTLAVVVSSKPGLAVINQLSAQELNLIYWRKKQYWQDGVRIHPVNLHAEHPLRLYFSKLVLGNAPSEQSNYWNNLYFHGTTPPYSVQSEEAVLRYIATTKGAIGYINACNTDERVRPLLWIEGDDILSHKPNLHCGP